MPGYFERLRQSALARDSVICVGLDPEPERIPGGAAGAARFCIDVVRSTSDMACAYKPNLAFWEQYGPDGLAALAELRAAVPADVPVILDAKRGDMQQTMRAYARALFDFFNADAVTVHAYLGGESLQPFTERVDRGVYVLARTSNPGAVDLQHLVADGEPLYLRVARLAAHTDQHRNVGIVVGATAPEEVAELRAAFPQMPFLLPGVGAQGGDLQGSLRAAWNGDPAAALVNASRSVIYAPDPARAAAQLRDEARAVVVGLR